MREYLFRGKRTDGSGWAYGYYWAMIKGGKAVHALRLADLTEPHAIVDPETVGQYTGFVDKNGRKIFEGDLCRFYNGEEYSIYQIAWKDNGWHVFMQEEYITSPDVLDKSFCERAEVIGNIYDNPELVKCGVTAE